MLLLSSEDRPEIAFYIVAMLTCKYVGILILQCPYLLDAYLSVVLWKDRRKDGISLLLIAGFLVPSRASQLAPGTNLAVPLFRLDE